MMKISKKIIAAVLMIAMITAAQPLQAENTEPTSGTAYQESADLSTRTTFAAIAGLIIVIGGLILLLNHNSNSSHNHS